MLGYMFPIKVAKNMEKSSVNHDALNFLLN